RELPPTLAVSARSRQNRWTFRRAATRKCVASSFVEFSSRPKVADGRILSLERRALRPTALTCLITAFALEHVILLRRSQPEAGQWCGFRPAPSVAAPSPPSTLRRPRTPPHNPHTPPD